jgi:phosphatidylglycerol:prolipoprotein diacylglycerol transferase
MIILLNEWEPLSHYSLQPDYGWFHIYAFTMTMGMILAIGLAAVKLWIRKIPVMELLIGAVFIVPISLFGASLIGKINKSEYPGFWSKFQFWEGGMAIHGGVLAGLISGLIIFHLIGRFRTKVSMWTYADAIVPNILIGQAVGRWGNFFNHELHGMPVANVSRHDANPLSWMADWLTSNTQFRYEGTDGVTINGLLMHRGDIYQMEPVFLYESIGLLLVWLIVTFVIPGFGRWISKKPWKLFPDVYQLDWKYSFKVFFTLGKARVENKMTYYDIWNDAYYMTFEEDAVTNYEKYYREHVLPKAKLNIVDVWNNGHALEKANNPHGFLTVKSGVEAGAYFLGWNIVRYAIDQRRSLEDALINYDRVASNAIIISSIVLGIIIIVLCQWVFPRFFRIPNYRYEKEYFALSSDLLQQIQEKKQLKASK